MTNLKKKPASKPAARDRVVYEVKGPKGTKQVDAATTADLKTVLTPLLGLEPYSAQAAAHLAHVERATVQGNGWSVRRLGVLAFQPDDELLMPQRQRRGAAQGHAKLKEQDRVTHQIPFPEADSHPQQQEPTRDSSEIGND